MSSIHPHELRLCGWIEWTLTAKLGCIAHPGTELAARLRGAASATGQDARQEMEAVERHLFAEPWLVVYKFRYLVP